MPLHFVEVAQAVSLSGVHRLHRSVGDTAEELASSRIHGHDYVVEAAVEAPVDPLTGMAIDQTLLRRAIRTAIEPLEGVIIDDVINPATTENMAIWIWDQLGEMRVPGLLRVSIGRPAHGDTTTYRGRRED